MDFLSELEHLGDLGVTPSESHGVGRVIARAKQPRPRRFQAPALRSALEHKAMSATMLSGRYFGAVWWLRGIWKGRAPQSRNH